MSERWETPPPFYAFRDRLARQPSEQTQVDLLWLEGMRFAFVGGERLR